MSQANLFGPGIHIAKPLYVPAANASRSDRATLVHMYSLRGAAAGTTIALVLNMALLLAGGASIPGSAWWLAAIVVSLFIGGVAAARVAGIGRRGDQTTWHGVMVWGLSLLLGAMMFALPGGEVFGGALAPLVSELAAAAMFEVEGYATTGGPLTAACMWTAAALAMGITASVLGSHLGARTR